MSGEAVTVTQALKPCKCGGKGELRLSSDHEIEWVRCTKCGVDGALHYSEAEAIAAWNRGELRQSRQSPAPTAEDELVEPWRGQVSEALNGLMTDCPDHVRPVLNLAATRIQSDAATIADLTARLAEAEARVGRLREVEARLNPSEDSPLGDLIRGIIWVADPQNQRGGMTLDSDEVELLARVFRPPGAKQHETTEELVTRLDQEEDEA